MKTSPHDKHLRRFFFGMGLTIYGVVSFVGLIVQNLYVQYQALFVLSVLFIAIGTAK